MVSSYRCLTFEAGVAVEGLTTTVSTKGQVILPKAVRDEMNWDAGTRLVAERTAEGVLLRPMGADFPQTREADVFGCLAYAGAAKTVDEMDAGIAAEVRRRHARGGG